MKTQDRIIQAIANTKRILPGYFQKTCLSRLAGSSAGSYFEKINSVDELEKRLVAAEWIEKKHALVAEECTSFVTKDIGGGIFGMIMIDQLPDKTVLTAKDDKNTGHISMTVPRKGLETSAVAETWIILGPENGEEVVYTFHPGAPVPRSMVPTETVPPGTRLTKREAIRLGFDLAKLI